MSVVVTYSTVPKSTAHPQYGRNSAGCLVEFMKSIYEAAMKGTFVHILKIYNNRCSRRRLVRKSKGHYA